MKDSPKRQLTKSAIKAFKKRWEEVNAFEREELRRTPTEQKLKQLAALMASIKVFGRINTLSKGESEIRERWNRLRKAYNVY